MWREMSWRWAVFVVLFGALGIVAVSALRFGGWQFRGFGFRIVPSCGFACRILPDGRS